MQDAILDTPKKGLDSKEYRKPLIITEDSFESSALACIKTPDGGNGHLEYGTQYVTGQGYLGTGTFHINEGFTSYTISCNALAYVS